MRARFYHEVAEQRLRRIIRVDLKSELFTYDIDQNALVLDRVMRARLHQTSVRNVGSPDRALTLLRRIQTHQVAFEGHESVKGLSTIDSEQAAILSSLHVKKPTADIQYLNL